MKIYIYFHIKNDITQFSHHNTSHLLRYAHFSYEKYLFTNNKDTLKGYLKKYPTCAIFAIFRVLFLYGPKHLGRFSNLHYCTFKFISYKILIESKRFFYKQHFYKQRRAEIGKKSSKC